MNGRRRDLIVLLAGLAGCDPFPSYDGFVRPDAGGAAAADASGPADVDAADDAGGPDAPVDPCSGATFCDRFERDGDVQGGWSEVFTESGGAVTIDALDAVSPTRSAKMTATGNGSEAYLRRMEMNGVGWAAFAFSMKTTAPPNDEIMLTRMGLYTGAPGTRIWLSVTSTSAVMHEARYDGAVDREEVTYVLPFHPLTNPVGAWRRWRIELDARSTPARMRVEVDGVVALDTSLKRQFLPGNLIADVGVLYASAPGAFEARVDDAALTVVR